jgi:hypothetical protein
VWKALTGIKDDDLALRLLVAGISICVSDALGVDDDGEKNFRDIALWIGCNLGHHRDIGLKVGAWGINRLITLPVFGLDGDILILTDDVHDFMDDVLARAVQRNPFLSPLTEPPVPWTQVRTGCLPKDHWARISLIRDHGEAIENAACKAIGTGRMQRVLDAINALQRWTTPSTPTAHPSSTAPVSRPSRDGRRVWMKMWKGSYVAHFSC